MPEEFDKDGHIQLDQRGAVEVNEFLQSTTNPRVYAAGDVVLPAGSIPPLAAVGLTEKAAREQGISVRVERGDTSGWYSSRRVREPVGMFKTVIDADSDRILGAHLLGVHAEEAINLFALAVRFEITAKDLRQMIYAYPTSGSDIPYML